MRADAKESKNVSFFCVFVLPPARVASVLTSVVLLICCVFNSIVNASHVQGKPH